jgi:hypothetical protein
MTTVPEYDAFYVALWPRPVRTTYAVSGDLGVAEDAVQTAFAKAYRSWRRISLLAVRAADSGLGCRRTSPRPCGPAGSSSCWPVRTARASTGPD